MKYVGINEITFGDIADNDDTQNLEKQIEMFETVLYFEYKKAHDLIFNIHWNNSEDFVTLHLNMFTQSRQMSKRYKGMSTTECYFWFHTLK